MRRRLIAAGAFAWLAPGVAKAATSHRLGILAVGSRAVEGNNWDPMLRTLAGLGHKEGSTLALEWRYANDESVRLDELAKELIGSRVHAAVTFGSLATRALQRATRTVPIITGAVTDPILGGFAQTLARPGGNITGLSMGGTEIAELQVGLLRAMVPRLNRLTIFRGGGEWVEEEVLGPMVAAAKQAGVTAVPSPIRDVASLEAALRGAGPPGTAAAFVYHVDQVEEKQLAALALRHRVPTMFTERRWVQAGGLMSYNMYHEDRMRRVAAMLDKVFAGMNPANSPFELPTNSQFVVNLRTATALGLVVPSGVLARADEVIE